MQEVGEGLTVTLPNSICSDNRFENVLECMLMMEKVGTVRVPTCRGRTSHWLAAIPLHQNGRLCNAGALRQRRY
jgi:hypothetical protein